METDIIEMKSIICMNTDSRLYYIKPMAEMLGCDCFVGIMVSSPIDDASSESFMDESSFDPIW